MINLTAKDVRDAKVLTADVRGCARINPPITRSPDHPITRLVIMLLVGFLSLPAPAQNKPLSVRLYSLHREQQVKLTANTGVLRWRSCEKCKAAMAPALIVTATAKGMTVADPLHPAKRKHKPPPEFPQVFIEGDYRVTPARGLTMSMAFPMHIKARGGQLLVLLNVPLEDYVAAVLAGESGDLVHLESQKALAVAVRTYAVRYRARHRKQGFGLCDSTHCQVMHFTGISASMRRAAEETRGQMLWYGGLPVTAFYHQNCGGHLASAREVWPDVRSPYLKAHDDPYCARVPLRWRAHLDRRKLQAALRRQGLAVPAAWTRLEVVARTESGRAQKLAFISPRAPPVTISASTMRFAIGRSFGWNEVRSDLYDIETAGDSVTFIGRGGGHGVGLCQQGAEEMAKEGKTYREILDFYYPGTTVGLTAAGGLAWQNRDGQRTELLSTAPVHDAGIQEAAEKILPKLESLLGWKLEFKPQLKVYPTLDAYRNSTGRPGWIAAFTRGRVISLQPLETLQQKGIVDSTLRHELAHMLIEMRAKAGTPLWFREGLAIYFSEDNHNAPPVVMTGARMEAALKHPEDRQRIERAYAAARTRVEKMVEKDGKDTVLRELREGLK